MLCVLTLGLLVVVRCWVEKELMEEVLVRVRQQDEKEDQGLHDNWGVGLDKGDLQRAAVYVLLLFKIIMSDDL